MIAQRARQTAPASSLARSPSREAERRAAFAVGSAIAGELSFKTAPANGSFGRTSAARPSGEGYLDDCQRQNDRRHNQRQRRAVAELQIGERIEIDPEDRRRRAVE